MYKYVIIDRGIIVPSIGRNNPADVWPLKMQTYLVYSRVEYRFSNFSENLCLPFDDTELNKLCHRDLQRTQKKETVAIFRVFTFPHGFLSRYCKCK